MDKTAVERMKLIDQKFIAEVQCIRILWDIRSNGYYRSTEKFVEWERIGKMFKLTAQQANQKWITLKEKYKKEKMKTDSRWSLLYHLKFLDSTPKLIKQVSESGTEVKKTIHKNDTNTKNNNIRRQYKRVQNNQSILAHKEKPTDLAIQSLPQKIEQTQKSLHLLSNDHNTKEVISCRPQSNSRVNSTESQQSDNNTELITPIVVSYAKQNPQNLSFNSQSDDHFVENYSYQDDTFQHSDYKSRCRAFGKYLGEELCVMQEYVGDALISDMLKIIVEEKCKKQNL